MREIVLIIPDIRSTHNVGSLFRTAEGLGVEQIYCTGYTPYPATENDDRLPHLATKLTKQINKTALGAEGTVPWAHHESVEDLLSDLKDQGYQTIALEQDARSVPLPEFKPSDKCVVLIGREVEGVEQQLLDLCESIVEIPMYGTKESFNVAQAAAIMLYTLRES